MSGPAVARQFLSEPPAPLAGPLVLEPTGADPWDAFVASCRGGSISQTSAWAAAKRRLGFESIAVVDRDGEMIRGGAEIIVRRFSPLGAIGYVAGGPVLKDVDERSVAASIALIERAARAAGVTALIVQPPEGGEAAAAPLAEAGYIADSPPVAPTATVRLDLRQDMDRLLARMGRSKRQTMRRFADNARLRLRAGDAADITLFAKLHAASAERQGFKPRSVSFLRAHWDALAPWGWVRMLFAEVDGEAVAGAWLTTFGASVIPRLSGWNGKGASDHPTEACDWGGICWARDNGFRYYDFGGFDRAIAEELLAGKPFPKARQHSPDGFKHRFGGDVVLLPLPWLKVLQPLARPLVHAALHAVGRGRWAARLSARLRSG
jgi:CelD/BcsL family acetyltransferase involved in cellulose biosynthesis